MQKILGQMMRLEKIIMVLIAAGLGVTGAGVAGYTIWDSAVSGGPVLTRAVTALEGLLLAVIIMEIYATVLAHLLGGQLQLENFLIIGAIASVRHILMTGAQMHAGDAAESRTQMLDLAVNAAVIVALVAALVLTRWSGRRKN